ncbi:MAG: hypothetical protein Q9228_006609 [Teloschistes exilis]
MALDVQYTTRAAHPPFHPTATCRASSLHLVPPPTKQKPSPLHPAPAPLPAKLDSTINHLLSLLPGHQRPDDDLSPDKLAPMVDMSRLQGPMPRTEPAYLSTLAPRKRKASPSSESSLNGSLSSKSVAGPCTRLGHRCDYNPRLSFKDDTPRIVEKMQHLTGQAKGVWERQSSQTQSLFSLHRSSLAELLTRLYDSQVARPQRHDFLPPFSRLTNDEDREKKAEFRSPGSYNVIVTPSSLAGLEEYRDGLDDSDGEETPITAGPQGSKASSNGFRSPEPENNVITFKDPDTVALRVFEDNTKKTASPMSTSSRFAMSSASSLTSPSSSGHYFQRTDMFMLPSQSSTPPPLTYEIAPQDPRDMPLICHYRNLLSRHLFHVHRGSITPSLAPGAFFTQELFERTVATFAPLYHALMALCALGIAHRSGIQNLDSLQHYQQALPCLQKTLRSPEDLSSDGALLTHFTLLLYEIAAAAPRGSNLWSQHITQLLRIFVLRSEMHETEPYSFLLWWICNIDTHALICGTSDGELVEAMLQYNMFPVADNIIQLNGTGECYNPVTEEAHAMPVILNFNRKIEILTCRLGLLRRNLQREADNLSRRGLKMSRSDMLERQRRVSDIQHALRRTWNEQMPPHIMAGLRGNTLPTRARGIFDNVSEQLRQTVPIGSIVKQEY